MSLAEAGLRRFRRVEYERLIEQGFFAADERLELIDGLLVVREPQGDAHAFAVEAAAEALRVAFGARARVRVQLPLALGDDSRPEPDISVVAGMLRDASRELPGGAMLVVEVSDSSLRLDRTEKASLYARAGIADYWIVDLVDRVLEVRRDPVRDASAAMGWRYDVTRRLAGRDVIAPIAAPRARIAVADLLR